MLETKLGLAKQGQDPDGGPIQMWSSFPPYPFCFCLFILSPPVVRSQLIGKDPDAGKDRRQDKKGTEDEMVDEMVSPTQWTWVWASSGRWWRTEKPVLLQSVGSQKVGHYWATEQKQNPFCLSSDSKWPNIIIKTNYNLCSNSEENFLNSLTYIYLHEYTGKCFCPYSMGTHVTFQPEVFCFPLISQGTSWSGPNPLVLHCLTSFYCSILSHHSTLIPFWLSKDSHLQHINSSLKP